MKAHVFKQCFRKQNLSVTAEFTKTPGVSFKRPFPSRVKARAIGFVKLQRVQFTRFGHLGGMRAEAQPLTQCIAREPEAISFPPQLFVLQGI